MHTAFDDEESEKKEKATRQQQKEKRICIWREWRSVVVVGTSGFFCRAATFSPPEGFLGCGAGCVTYNICFLVDVVSGLRAFGCVL